MNLLLAELHAHTTWSDGELSLPALVDLYGMNGFDVLCVTDHTLRGDKGTRRVGMHNWRAYLDVEPGEQILFYGNFKQGFVIVERIGMTVELIPHLMGPNRLPTGERGLLCWFRNSSAVLVDEALRLLVVAES